MSTANQVRYTPSVKSFIPLLYVAWADGLLSPSEVKLITKKIKDGPLSEEEKKTILEWVNPQQWPDGRTFKDWMALMKESGPGVDLSGTDAIVELGIAMASRSSMVASPDLKALRAVLKELQGELNIPPLAKFRALRPGPSKPRAEHPAERVTLQMILDGSSYADKERIKSLLSDPEFEREEFRDKERYRTKVLTWTKLLAAQGYGALAYPNSYGGEDDIVKYARIFEVIAMYDMSLGIKFGVQFGLFGGSVQHLGTKKHHDKYLKDLGQGKLLGCFAMTETGHGSNVRDLETTATYDHSTKSIVVHSPRFESGKEYIGNALHSEMASVFTQLIVEGKNQGVHAVLVPLRDKHGQLLPGIEIKDCGYKMGLNGVDNGRIWFDSVSVPVDNLLNKYGNINSEGKYQSDIENQSKRFFTMLGTLVAGRICVGKGAISAAKSALTIAVKYALKRRQFGPDQGEQEMLIMDYPTHQRRLMPRLARCYAADFALQYLIEKYSAKNEADSRLIETQAAGIKAYATRFATETIQECREACGGKGYLSENRFADLKADADIFTTFEGDNTVLLQLVAKGLLSSFKEEFNDGGFRGAIRYLANQMSDSFLALNPMYKRKTDADHLCNPKFHLHAFHYRQRKLLYSLGSRMRDMFKKRITPYDVFLRTQNHMIELANAYVELIVLEQFLAKLDTIEEGPEKEILQTLYQLFALETIEVNKGWYLEQDYLEYTKTKAIRRTVDRLCAEVRVQCEELVDAFGIPNYILGAEIIER